MMSHKHAKMDSSFVIPAKSLCVLLPTQVTVSALLLLPDTPAEANGSDAGDCAENLGSRAHGERASSPPVRSAVRLFNVGLELIHVCGNEQESILAGLERAGFCVFDRHVACLG